MEAQVQAGATAGSGAPEPKLKVDKFADGNITALKFAGTIDEQFSGKQLAANLKGGVLILDLADITKITSFGIREWVDFVQAAGEKCEPILFVELAPKVVDQFNMVANFGGKGRVLSFYAPFRCDYCDDDRRKLIQTDRDFEAIKNKKLPEAPCPTCGNPEYFDEDPSSFFTFLANHQPFELDPQIATFLAARLNYAVADGARKIKVDKYIDKRSVYIKLAGDLDGSFPREKLAEGLEGDIVFDLSGIGKIDPAGAAEWRAMMKEIAASTDRILLTGCPPAFVERLTKEDDLGGKAQVLSFAMPYTCAKCATTASQQIDVEQHFDVLKFATPPEMKCQDCGGDTACAASDGLLAHLATLPKPAPDAEVRKFIKAALQKTEKRYTAPSAASPTMVSIGAGGGRGLTVAVAVLALVVLGGGGFVFWKLRGTAGIDESGQLAGASEGKPPAWISKGDFYREGDNLYFVGSTPAFTNDQDTAIQEAEEAALERAVHELATSIKLGAFIDHVLQQYQPARAKALTDLERAAVGRDLAALDQARKAAREGRARVAASFRKTAGAKAPQERAGFYWEKYKTPGGDRYRGYVRYAIPKASFETLMADYQLAKEGLGVKVLTYFPGLAWRHREIDQGAVIVGVKGDSPLRLVGLVEGDLINSIEDRVITSAEKFEKILTQEWEDKCKSGDKLAFRVKHGEAAPADMHTRVSSAGGKCAGEKAEARVGGPRRPRPEGYVPPSRPAGGGIPDNIWKDSANE